MRPANISIYLHEKPFNFPPNAKPKQELINVTKAINIAACSIGLSDKARVMPAEKASMLVAIPIKNKHNSPRQVGFSFLFWHAS